MRRVFILLIGLIGLLPGRIFAQQQDATALTLDQCIQYALEHAVAAQNAVLDQKIAAAKVKETVGLGLPQISGTGSLVDNPKLPRFYGTYYPAQPGQISFFDLNNISGTPNPGDVLAAKNFFQLRSSGGLSATANQILFDGTYLVGLKAAKTYQELSLRALNQTKEQVIIQVTKAYYAVVINKERITLFNDNIARNDSLLKSTSAQNANGFAEEIDVDRVKVNLNNLTVQRDNFRNTDEYVLALLKFQMNYPADQPLIVVGSIKDFQIDNPVEAYKQNWDYSQRLDYQTLETNKRAQELTIRGKYANSLPSLKLFATYGYSTQSNNIGGVFKTNSSTVQDNGIAGPDKWYDYSQIGINLNIPIFSGFQHHYQVQQEKLRLVKIQNEFSGLKNAINLDITQSNVNFENAVKSLSAQRENMDLAAKVARVTKIKYEQGVGSNIEVVDAENSLRSAQIGYYNAVFDAMIAKVDIDKAYGKVLGSTIK